MHNLLTHVARCDGVGIYPALQIGDDILDRPAADALAVVGRDVRRMPPLECRALEVGRVVVGTEPILRRMTCAAMAERVDQIAPAISFGRI